MKNVSRMETFSKMNEETVVWTGEQPGEVVSKTNEISFRDITKTTLKTFRYHEGEVPKVITFKLEDVQCTRVTLFGKALLSNVEISTKIPCDFPLYDLLNRLGISTEKIKDSRIYIKLDSQSRITREGRSLIIPNPKYPNRGRIDRDFFPRLFTADIEFSFLAFFRDGKWYPRFSIRNMHILRRIKPSDSVEGSVNTYVPTEGEE